MKKLSVIVFLSVAYFSSFGQDITTQPETFEGSGATYKWVVKKGKMSVVDNPNISSGNASYTSALVTKTDEADICNVLIMQNTDLSTNKKLKIKIFADKDVRVNFLLAKKISKEEKARAFVNVKGNSTWKEYTIDFSEELSKPEIKGLTFDVFKIVIGKDKKSTEKGSFYFDDIQFVK